MLDQLIDAYLEKYPNNTREQAYPFILGMLSTLVTEEKLPSFIQTVKDFS